MGERAAVGVGGGVKWKWKWKWKWKLQWEWDSSQERVWEWHCERMWKVGSWARSASVSDRDALQAQTFCPCVC